MASPQEAPNLRQVDPDTGELLAPGCRDCHNLATELAGAHRERDALKDEVTRLAVKVRALQREREQERLEHARRADIETVFEHWREQTGKRNSQLTPDRFDAIAARLADGYTVEQLRLACVAAGHYPWPTVRDGQKPMREIETIFRNGRWLEDYANRGAEWLRAHPNFDVIVSNGEGRASAA